MNINELEELAKAATPGPWSNRVVEGMEDNIHSCNEDKWIVFSDMSVVVEQNDSDYIAAANPSAISELIAAYREAVDALCSVIDWDIRREYIVPYSVRDPIHRTLDTAKRIGAIP